MRDADQAGLQPELIEDPAVWEAGLAQLPRPHLLQSWQWADFKSRWGWTKHPYLWRDADGDQPVMAAMVLKRRLGPMPFHMLYAPRGPVTDYDDLDRQEMSLATLESVARRQRALFIKIDPEVPQAAGVDETAPIAHGVALVEHLKRRGWRFSPSQPQFRNTVELDLTGSLDDILAGMKAKTRYNIRLAGRREVTVRAGTPADFPLIMRMYAETATRDGFAIRPEAYYLDIWQRLHQAGHAQPFIAEYENTPLGAVVMVQYHGRAIYMYGASTDHERQRMPNYLLQWEAIRWAQAQGCHTYDFWGAPDVFNETDRMWGVWRFKAGFHGTVVHHIGAWDFPARPLLYWLFTNALPRYQNWLRRQ